MNDAGGDFIRAGALDELRNRRRMVLGTPTGAVLVVADDDDVVALDNRCPHMGFPLHRGSIEDGILTCHWHHARFDLRSGSTSASSRGRPTARLILRQRPCACAPRSMARSRSTSTAISMSRRRACRAATILQPAPAELRRAFLGACDR
jgi:nitrite reductase/ring-hydroxylating ferredoxin subunit